MINIIDYSEKAIAVTGDTKALKDHFKAIGGRFNPRLTCGAGWIFPKAKRALIDALVQGERPMPIPTPKNKEDKDIFLSKDEIRESFETYGKAKGRHLEYLCKTFSLGVRLSDGNIVCAEREELKTDFCFGYGFCGVSTQEDSDAAHDRMHTADTDPNFFIDENLKDLREIVSKLKTGKDEQGRLAKVYLQGKWIYESNQRSICFSPYTLEELKDGCGNVFMVRNARKGKITEVNEQDKQLLIKLYETALEKRTKRVNTYLKRYGLTKLHTWTYLSD